MADENEDTGSPAAVEAATAAEGGDAQAGNEQEPASTENSKEDSGPAVADEGAAEATADVEAAGAGDSAAVEADTDNPEAGEEAAAVEDPVAPETVNAEEDGAQGAAGDAPAEAAAQEGEAGLDNTAEEGSAEVAADPGVDNAHTEGGENNVPDAAEEGAAAASDDSGQGEAVAQPEQAEPEAVPANAEAEAAAPADAEAGVEAAPEAEAEAFTAAADSAVADLGLGSAAVDVPALAAGEGAEATAFDTPRTHAPDGAAPATARPDAEGHYEYEDDTTELPPNWERVLDPDSNYVYYWNTVTDEVQWSRPTPLPGTSEQIEAATKLQAVARGNAARKEVQEQHEAATKVQAQFRGGQARAEVEGKRQEAEEGKEGKEGKEDEAEELQAQHDAATKVQARVRGAQTRAQLSARRSEDGEGDEAGVSKEEADEGKLGSGDEGEEGERSEVAEAAAAAEEELQGIVESSLQSVPEEQAQSPAPLGGDRPISLSPTPPSTPPSSSPQPDAAAQVDDAEGKLGEVSPQQVTLAEGDEDDEQEEDVAAPHEVKVQARSYFAVSRGTQTSSSAAPGHRRKQLSAFDSPASYSSMTSPSRSRLPVYKPRLTGQLSPTRRRPQRIVQRGAAEEAGDAAGAGVRKGDSASVGGGGRRSKGSRGKVKTVDSVLGKYEAGLAMVFTSYAKAQAMLSPRPAAPAAGPGSEVTRINLAMFLKCCRDFGLLGDLLRREQVIATFKAFAPAASRAPQLSHSQFAVCLAQCAALALSQPPFSSKYVTEGDRADAVFKRFGLKDLTTLQHRLEATAVVAKRKKKKPVHRSSYSQASPAASPSPPAEAAPAARRAPAAAAPGHGRHRSRGGSIGSSQPRPSKVEDAEAVLMDMGLSFGLPDPSELLRNRAARTGGFPAATTSSSSSPPAKKQPRRSAPTTADLAAAVEQELPAPVPSPRAQRGRYVKQRGAGDGSSPLALTTSSTAASQSPSKPQRPAGRSVRAGSFSNRQRVTQLEESRSPMRGAAAMGVAGEVGAGGGAPAAHVRAAQPQVVTGPPGRKRGKRGKGRGGGGTITRAPPAHLQTHDPVAAHGGQQQQQQQRGGGGYDAGGRGYEPAAGAPGYGPPPQYSAYARGPPQGGYVPPAHGQPQYGAPPQLHPGHGGYPPAAGPGPGPGPGYGYAPPQAYQQYPRGQYMQAGPQHSPVVDPGHMAGNPVTIGQATYARADAITRAQDQYHREQEAQVFNRLDDATERFAPARRRRR